MGARFLCHVVSGYILFSGWAEWYFTQEGFPAWGAQLVQSLSPEGLGLAYSAVYNAMYMVPEMVIVSLVALLLTRVPRIVEKVS
jgi:thiamine transporter